MTGSFPQPFPFLARIFRPVFALLALAIAPAVVAAGPAPDLPRAASVSGGVAVVELGTVLDYPDPPQVRFGERPVWVATLDGRRIAVVGIPLDTPPGMQALQVAAPGGMRTVRFTVADKRYAEQRIRLKDAGKVTLSPADEQRALAEIARIGELKRSWRGVPDTDAAFVLPAEGRLAGRFGLRRFFNGEARAPHSGLDVAVPRGTPVKAAAEGNVLAVDDYFFNGKTVFVDHGNGLLSMYCHLERIDVRAGEAVDRGQPLGLSGMTGRASGPHLHWSVVLNGAMVDPELFLPR